MADANQEQPSSSGLQPDPFPRRQSGKALKRIAALLLLAVAGGGIWLGLYAFAPSPVDRDTVLLIPKGAGVRQINAILARHDLAGEDVRFLILARLTGSAGRLRAGEYLVAPHLTPLQVLRLLEKGDVIHHQVTIPEGLSLAQIIQVLQQGGWIDSLRFLELVRDRDFIRSLGIDQPSLEGYLFPDTYLLTRGDISEEAIIAMMVARFHAVWKETIARNIPKMTQHEVITLASIVEKETGNPAERPIIARVFLNRLQRNMRLQSDPTVIYGLEEFDGNLTRADLNTKTAYNTYVISGLPPGPICSPGRESIEAVLQPADEPFLYFVSRNDGTHYFSSTLQEHNRAVHRFQKTPAR